MDPYAAAMIYRILLVLAVIFAGILTFLFLWQAADGPYAGLCLSFVLLAAAWALIAGAIALQRRRKLLLACLLLLPLVVLLTMSGLFFLLFTGSTWR